MTRWGMVNHDNENARAAREAHAAMMSAAREGRHPRFYLYFRTGRLEAFSEDVDPLPPWELAWNESLPSDRTVDQLIAYMLPRTRRLPYLPPDPAPTAPTWAVEIRLDGAPAPMRIDRGFRSTADAERHAERLRATPAARAYRISVIEERS